MQPIRERREQMTRIVTRYFLKDERRLEFHKTTQSAAQPLLDDLSGHRTHTIAAKVRLAEADHRQAEFLAHLVILKKALFRQRVQFLPQQSFIALVQFREPLQGEFIALRRKGKALLSEHPRDKGER